MSYAALELESGQHQRLKELLSTQRREPWGRRPAFRLLDLPPLGNVSEDHLFDFFVDGNSHCDASIQDEMSQRLIAKTSGRFEAIAALMQEAEAHGSGTTYWRDSGVSRALLCSTLRMTTLFSEPMHMPSRFELLRPDQRDPERQAELAKRTLPETLGNHRQAARFYQPDADLVDAVNVALAVGAPLLLTGEPGTGKTQVAHYLAWYFNLEEALFPLFVRSTTTAEDLYIASMPWPTCMRPMIRHSADSRCRSPRLSNQALSGWPMRPLGRRWY